MKRNCWEFKQCGREPGGSKVDEMGECPAAAMVSCDGLHGGVSGGRVCWAIVGTMCDDGLQETYAQKLHNCIGCAFRAEVEVEERGKLMQPGDIIMYIRRAG